MKRKMTDLTVIYLLLTGIVLSEGITNQRIVYVLVSFLFFSASLYFSDQGFGITFFLMPMFVYTGKLWFNHNYQKAEVVAGLVLLGIVLICRSKKINRLENILIETRDHDTEVTMNLQRRNSLLIEQQDNEIRMATLRERNRIAREIHDNVGHLLSRALLMVGALQTVNKDKTLELPLVELNKTLDTAMTEVRSSVHDLHEESISLKENIEELVKTLKTAEKQGQPRFLVQLDYDCSEEIGREYKLTLIGVCKEAVSNIIKHSNGDRVEIILREQPGFYRLSVYDNGTVSKAVRQKTESGLTDGIGLENMRERVELLGGSIRFFIRDGFTVYVNLLKNGRNNESEENR